MLALATSIARVEPSGPWLDTRFQDDTRHYKALRMDLHGKGLAREVML